MSFIDGLRRLRHGPLRFFGPLWSFLGRRYRGLGGRLGLLKPIKMRIGEYGPFLLKGHFAFSDFESWGKGHNNGFAACIEACRGKKCLLDVGAHIGMVSLPASQALAQGGSVHAFEPAEYERRVLSEHVRLNDFTNINVVPCLVGSEDKEDALFHERSDDPRGMGSIAPVNDQKAYHPTRKRQISLDGYCDEQGLSPDVIKIDVEGAELAVLRGARKTLSRFCPLIFLSVHPGLISSLGESLEGLQKLIDEIGYECRNIDGSPVNGFASHEYRLTPKER